MLASFSVIPIGAGEELKEEVAAAIDLIDRSGLDYRTGAMQTTVEGEMDEVIALIIRCHKKLREKSPRVLTNITIDDREGAHDRLFGKVKDVEDILGKELKHE